MADRYWVGGTGTWNTTSTTNWSATSGGAGGASAPTSADNVIIDANSGTGTITCATSFGSGTVCYDITVTATQAITLGGGTGQVCNVFGSLTYPATGSFVNNVNNAFYANDANTKTITTNGKSLAGGPTLNGTGTFVLGSALSCGSLVFTGTPTLDVSASNYSITCGSFNAISTNSNFTFVPRQGTLTVTIAAFQGGNKTYYNVAFSNTSLSSGTLGGANTFNNLTFAARASAGIGTVSIGANQTINGTLTAQSGNTDPTKRILFASDTIGTQRTITAAAIDIQCADFRDIVGAGAATWSDSTRAKYWGDCQGNSGITFNAGRTVYWNLAGTQNWNATAWSNSSGGTPNAQYFPLAQDTATFTEAGSVGTAKTTVAWNIGSIQMADGISNRVTGMTLSFVGSSPWIYGSITFFTGLTFTSDVNIIIAGRTTQTITSAGISFPISIVMACSSGTVRLLDALTMPSTATFTLTSGTLDLNNNTLTCGAFSSSNSNTRSIAFGTGNITVTGNGVTVWDCATPTNLTCSGSRSVYLTYSGSIGTRTCRNGLGSSPGSAANACDFYITAGSDSVNFLHGTQIMLARSITFQSGFTGTLGLGIYQVINGITLSTGMSCLANIYSDNYPVCPALGTEAIVNLNGVVYNRSLTIGGVGTVLGQTNGGTVKLASDVNLGTGNVYTATLTSGTLDLNGKTLTTSPTGTFSTSNSNVRAINFGNGGVISLPGSGTAFNATVATNLTTSGTGRIDMTSASAKTFAGGGASYPMLNQGGAGALTLTGVNTFQDITNTVRGASIILPAATTTTVNNLSLNGSSGNLVAITSSVSGSKATINKTSGQVGLQYCSLKDIQAQGGAKFRAPSNYGNTNVSGNAGWDFGALNTTQDNFMFFFCDTIR